MLVELVRGSSSFVRIKRVENMSNFSHSLMRFFFWMVKYNLD